MNAREVAALDCFDVGLQNVGVIGIKPDEILRNPKVRKFDYTIDTLYYHEDPGLDNTVWSGTHQSVRIGLAM